MNKFLNRCLFLFLLMILCFYNTDAQCDFINANFAVKNQRNIVYGQAEMFNGRNVDLKMNVFKPVGDDNTQRPLFLWVHGGGFSSGSADDLNQLCQIMASKGIVTATISYRLGFVKPEGDDYPSTFDSHEIIRAVYRGMQDTKGAIRFLKSRHLLDSTDINQVFVGGLSAGGFIALAATYMDKAADKPSSVDEINPIIQGGETIKRPDLGSIFGNINTGKFDASVKGIVNIYSGLMDLNFIEQDEEKYVYIYHQTLDPVVPCGYDQPYWAFPNFRERYPFVYGSCEILKRYDELGFNKNNISSIIYDGNEHSIHDLFLFTQTLTTFLNGAICDTTTLIRNPNLKTTPLYPNPSKDFIHIPEVNNISIQSINGQSYQVITKRNDDEIILDISHLNPGIYVISGRQSNNQIHHWKVIKL